MSADLILVAFSLFTWGIGEGMFFYFQPIYLQELGADPERIRIMAFAAQALVDQRVRERGGDVEVDGGPDASVVDHGVVQPLIKVRFPDLEEP